ncbi:discoidin domain-containing protein [Rhizosaccharibacter radicis]|uniref:Discoidin domain-containing protein n=1 Tax=Rhizosaccharibacter radicis TaxID=2782605 RepID=A0ABT1VV20_9PROT|nr:discoidin domain-containing protein [Acetobacteraceae bacterium KSS12]
MNAGIILIRTHYVDEYLMRMAEEFSRGGVYDVAFAIDERKKIWDTGRFGKVSLTFEAMAAAGLFTGADPAKGQHEHALDAFWRCGDYILYLALDEFPQAQRFWMIENDVLINMAHPQDLFLALDAASQDDLLATHVVPASPDWFWWRTIEDRFSRPYRCFFPLIRASRRAAEHLRDKRRIEKQTYLRDGIDLWMVPNDEAFVGSTMASDGFTIADLNDYGSFYDGSRFDFWTLINRHRPPPLDDRLYHSVRAGEQFLAALRRKMPDVLTLLGYVEDDPEITPEMILEDVAIRLTEMPQERQVLLAHIDKLPVEILRLLASFEAASGLPLSGNVLQRLSAAVTHGPDLALGRPAFQSSVCAWSPRQHRCVDAMGAVNGQTDSPFSFHTDEDDEPWWAVDLLHEIGIASVRIHNRQDMPYRLDGYRIQISSDARKWITAYEMPAGTTAGPLEDVPLPIDATGRFLRIIVPRKTCLHLVQVEVFGR